MLNLAEYRNKPQRLADFLPWAALVAQGVILNKDGSFQRTARFRGPDLESATPAELIGTAARLNNALRRLGSGWAVFVEAQRNPANSYPQSSFPDPVSAFASGWMRVRARARQRGVELPLVISDHADWDGLTATIAATGAGEIWVTHGQEDALVHWCQTKGLAARPLDLVGYGDEEESETIEGEEA